MKNKRISELSNELWERTKIDWWLSYTISLTEPTCGEVSIFPDVEVDLQRLSRGQKEMPHVKNHICKSSDIIEGVIEGLELLLKKL